MKTNKFLLLGALSLICSCVNNKYDLNLDISKDVKIEGNKVTLPFGSLKLVTLDSLIDVDDIDVLEKSTDGTYSITKGDSISTITETVDPIEISVDGNTVTVSPKTQWNKGCNYIYIKSGIKDTDGNMLGKNYKYMIQVRRS